MFIAFLLQLFLLNQVSELKLGQETLPARAVESIKGQTEWLAAAMPVFNPDYYVSSLPESASKGDPVPYPPIKTNPLSLGVELTAKSALVMDRETKAVLFSKAMDSKVPVASLTKLVSALVVLKYNPELKGQARLEYEDYIPNLTRFIRPGELYQFRDLLYAAIIASDNNAISLLSRSLGITQEVFVDQMNLVANEIGMGKSHFVEPTGLDPNNISTAHDVALLLDYSLSKEPIYSASQFENYTIYPVGRSQGRKIISTDKLLGSYINKAPYRLKIGKTGYIEKAGYCFSAVVSNEEKQSSLIVVVLGSQDADSRFQEAKSLVTWSFDNYKWVYGVSY